jgi:hypothetical protein
MLLLLQKAVGGGCALLAAAEAAAAAAAAAGLAWRCYLATPSFTRCFRPASLVPPQLWMLW